MLNLLFPRSHARYAALPLLGSILDDFVTWMPQQGYRRSTMRVEFQTLPQLDRLLRRRGAKLPSDITARMLDACWISIRRDVRFSAGAGMVHSVQRYLEAKSILAPSVSSPGSPTSLLVATYRNYLLEVRGLAYKTIHSHIYTAISFLGQVKYDTTPSQLQQIGVVDMETFIRRRGKHLTRASLQHEAAQLRAFVRFLAGRAAAPTGLDALVDTPRTYRLEKLPRAVPWETVRKFLQSIDRSSALGLRDYAMFLLIATYGLRVSEIADLKLNDVHWRARTMHVPSRKTSATINLPLTDAAATAVVEYIRKGRPNAPQRELFLRMRAPVAGLTPTAVSMAFQGQVARTGADIPFFGAHCLRHSYAVHLLRQGTPLKTIGDLLHHRTAEATCMYLRLATEDLREVALPMPKEYCEDHSERVQP